MRLGIFHLVIISAPIILHFVNCSGSECPEGNDIWDFKGKENVGIDTLLYEDTISANDTLYIEIQGNTISGDKFDNITIEIEQNTNSIIIGLYADIYDWKGDGCYIIPPTNLWPFADIKLSPSFHEGNLYLIAKQPYDFDTVGFVTVLP